MDLIASPQGSYYMSIMDAAEFLRCKSTKVEEYIKSGHIRISANHRRRLVIFADVQQVRDELRGTTLPKTTPLIEPNATLGKHPGCGACLKACATCKRILSRQPILFTTGKYSGKQYHRERLVTKEEARFILGCTAGEIDKYVAKGKLRANFDRKNHHYYFSDVADMMQQLMLKVFDHQKIRQDIIGALGNMIELRRQEMAELDMALVEHSVGHEEPLFRYGRVVDLTDRPDRNWYVYHLCHPNGKPFYIGKGIGDRMYHHVKEAAKGIQSYKCNLIRKLQSRGKEICYRVVFVTPDEQEAYEYEIYEIARIGMKKLTNMTPGGWTREQHDHVFGSNVTNEKLNFKQFSQRLSLYPEMTPKERKRSIAGWAYSRVFALEGLLREANGLSHIEARQLIEAELAVVQTYTARQHSFSDLFTYQERRYNDWKEYCNFNPFD